MNYSGALLKKIKNKSTVVGIIGIGYVGSDLAKGSSTAGFKTIGFTRRPERALEINKAKTRNFRATTDISKLSECDIICICVPTPVHEDKTPDLEAVASSLEKTAQYLSKGTLVIIESTIAPGTTRNFALPILAATGLAPEKEFFLSFSPERVDPGNKKYTIFNTPKVVSGISDVSRDLAVEFYNNFIDQVVPVSSCEVAEMSKVLENTFRMVNISVSNELLNYTNKLGIDMWEVISASATKPFGFIPHYPGPGIGGHCIPVDPYYLLDDARRRGINLEIIEAAGRVNEAQPKKVVARAIEIIRETNGQKKGHSVMLVGLAYKENISDRRESPAVRIWELLRQENVKVSYHDPYIPEFEDSLSQTLSQESVADLDMIIIATSHSNIDYEALVSFEKPILDTRNILKDYSHPHIYRI